MARSDWAAFLTEPAAEYDTRTELERFGLSPYLPQQRRRFVHDGAVTLRQYPLFPRYLLLPHREAQHLAIRACRHRLTLLASEPGPWRCPHDVVQRLIEAEYNGTFDEPLARPGGNVTVARSIPAIIARALSSTTLELLTPLLGGVRAVVKTEKVRHNA